ncbi:hypothetical protein F5Y17DRAFT_459889 [Xylariaceae sp. FL0594]|nr:hypothetical protein F5Y17DRAFT_459889 [Xylariaceae sp. FL0594]
MSRAGKLAPEQLPVLFIKNLNYEVTDGDLFKLFDPDETGIIRQIRKGISLDTKGTAYVVFWNAMDAKNALEKLNGFNFQNRYLVVLWHQPEKTLRMKESKEDMQARQESLGQLKKHPVVIFFYLLKLYCCFDFRASREKASPGNGQKEEQAG